ncbi:hypothetical protein BDV12DRAFT_52399 [Aspergillus spectabilis]
MKRLLLPRLERIESLYFIQAFEDNWFDFGGLKSADTISIAGAWTNISFGLLDSVDGGLTIVTDPTWIVDYRSNPVDINCPSLVRARWMSIKGYVKSLVTTSLEALGAETDSVTPSGMEVHANYTNLRGVHLGQLHELHGEFLIEGHFSSVNLGGMQETDATTTVRAKSRVEVHSALKCAGSII